MFIDKFLKVITSIVSFWSACSTFCDAQTVVVNEPKLPEYTIKGYESVATFKCSPNKLLLKFKDGFPLAERQQFLERESEGGTIFETTTLTFPDATICEIKQLPFGEDILSFRKKLNAYPEIEFCTNFLLYNGAKN